MSFILSVKHFFHIRVQYRLTSDTVAVFRNNHVAVHFRSILCTVTATYCCRVLVTGASRVLCGCSSAGGISTATSKSRSSSRDTRGELSGGKHGFGVKDDIIDPTGKPAARSAKKRGDKSTVGNTVVVGARGGDGDSVDQSGLSDEVGSGDITGDNAEASVVGGAGVGDDNTASILGDNMPAIGVDNASSSWESFADAVESDKIDSTSFSYDGGLVLIGGGNTLAAATSTSCGDWGSRHLCPFSEESITLGDVLVLIRTKGMTWNIGERRIESNMRRVKDSSVREHGI